MVIEDRRGQGPHLTRYREHSAERQRRVGLTQQIVERLRAELEEDAEVIGLHAAAEEAHLHACARHGVLSCG